MLLSKTNTPHILQTLLGNTSVIGDKARAEMCWTDTPLEKLHLHGAGCGLSAYLEEIRARIVPLLTQSPQSV